jgi:hypothetical protein
MSQNISEFNMFHNDNGGRRSGHDRRRFAYSNHIPERRLSADDEMNGERRTGKDRRKVFCERFYSNLRSDHCFERRIAYRSYGENPRRSDFYSTAILNRR